MNRCPFKIAVVCQARFSHTQAIHCAQQRAKSRDELADLIEGRGAGGVGDDLPGVDLDGDGRGRGLAKEAGALWDGEVELSDAATTRGGGHSEAGADASAGEAVGGDARWELWLERDPCV